MDDNDLPSICMATRRVSVEYNLRRVPQEGLEGEPVERIIWAFDNKYTYAYMRNLCGKEQQVM